MYDDSVLNEISNLRSRLDALIERILVSNDLMQIEIDVIVARSVVSSFRNIAYERIGLKENS